MSVLGTSRGPRSVGGSKRRSLKGAAASIQAQIDYAYSLISEHYFELTHAELAILRSSLLAFFQDARIKVPIPLRQKAPTKGEKEIRPSPICQNT